MAKKVKRVSTKRDTVLHIDDERVMRARRQPDDHDIEDFIKPEPSCIYGFISLVDPRNNELHLILNYDYDPPRPRGLPDLDVVFRSVDLRGTHTVSILGTHGIRSVGWPVDDDGQETNRDRLLTPCSRPIALFYYYRLVQDSTLNRVPEQAVDRTRPNTILDQRQIIRYNPDQWRFETVNIGRYGIDFPDPDGSIGGPNVHRLKRGTQWWSYIPLSRRSGPFPEFSISMLSEYFEEGTLPE